MRVRVVGHVEWVQFGRVDRVPEAGQIAHTIESWDEAAGGGAVVAVQLAKLAGACTFFTALGSDDIGDRCAAELQMRGLTLHAAIRPERTRRAVTLIDASGERTIITLGNRLTPLAADPLPWTQQEQMQAVFVSAADPEAIRRARKAKILVATSRILSTLLEAGVQLDALIGSAEDPSERFDPHDLSPPPRLSVLTEGSRGGWYVTADGGTGRFDPAPPPGPIVDTYGSGDSFMGGLTYALAAGMDVPEALELASRCGAAGAAGRGPYTSQLTAADL